jgi:two-component system, NarL family, sensor histidine kinase UhpB
MARNLKTLLIEDSDHDAKVILASLAAGGFSVDHLRVQTAEELREALLSTDWELVLSDFNLPRFSAIEALTMIRESPVRAPMIVVTGTIGEEAAVSVIKAGATDMVMKQGLKRLGPVVERCLRDQEARHQYDLAVAALNESEARFRAIAANLPGVVYQALLLDDGSAEMAYVSEGSHWVLGVAAEALMSRPALLSELIVDEDRQSFLESQIQAAQQLTPCNWEGRIRAPSAGGEVKWVNLRASVRKMSSGTVVADGIISNITESKLAQQAIQEQQTQLRELAAHVERVKEDERGHLARELHDDLGGTLTAARIDLAWLRGRLPADQTPLLEKTDSMEGLLDSAIQATGRISRSLRPLVLDHGISAAIEWQIKEFRKRMGIRCDFVDSTEDFELDADIATALFRIFQETLTNIAKHARATHVDITLEQDGQEVVLTVTDDGCGLGSADLKKDGSYGIRGMRERTAALGGKFTISETPGSGTCVRVSLPVNQRPGPLRS